MSTPAAFATIQDLTNFWRAPDNEDRATYLLQLASDRLRLIAEDSGIDLDAKVAANPAYKSVLQWAVMEAVKRALITPDTEPSIESKQMAAGPYSENIKYVNPTGDLFYRKAELIAVGLNGGQSLGSISTTPNTDVYYRPDFYS